MDKQIKHIADRLHKMRGILDISAHEVAETSGKKVTKIKSDVVVIQ